MARRAASLNDFIGQRRLIRLMRKLVAGAQLKGAPLPSLLFVGPPGIGKSACARAVARAHANCSSEIELTNFRHIVAARGLSSTIAETLQSMKYCDFLFLDEAHALDAESQELTFQALDNSKTYSTSNGRLDRSRLESIADITIVAATTEPGRLLPALRSRLVLVDFDPYLAKELKEIAIELGRMSGVEITPQAARHLAERSNGTPRDIEKLVKVVTLLEPGHDKLGLEQVRSALATWGIDDNGLTTSHRTLLLHLHRLGGHSSLEALAACVGSDSRFVRTVLEPKLVELGFLEIGTSGRRTITEAGVRGVADAARSDDVGGEDSPKADLPQAGLELN